MAKDKAYTPNQNLEALGPLGAELKRGLERFKENYNVAKQITETLNPERKLNLAFYVGNQFSEWDTGLNAVVPATADMGENIEPTVDNVVRTLLDTRVAMLSNQTPTMEAVTMSSQPEDVSSANLSNTAIQKVWDRLSLSDAFAHLHKLSGIKYNAFGYILWDWNAGAIGSDGDSEGEVQIEIVHPENVFVDPMAERVMPERTEPTDARWLFYLCVRDIGYVTNHKQWNKHGKERTTAGNTVIYGGVPPEQDIKTYDAILPTDDQIAAQGELGLDAREAAKGASSYLGKEKDKNESKPKGSQMVRMLYYFEHPNHNAPHGRFGVFLPDNEWHMLEFRDELPFATETHRSGLFPWVMVVDVECPGRLAGLCRMSEARPLQVGINKRLTQWFEERDRLLPMILADEDSGVNAASLQRSGIAQILTYRSSMGNNPVSVHFPAAALTEAQLAMNEVTWLTHRCEDKMEIHSVAYHPHKEGTTLGEIEMMRLEDVSRLKSNDVKRAERLVYAPAMKLILRLMQRYYTSERLLEFFGDAHRETVRRFKSADCHIKDVKILAATSVEMSRSLRVALGLRMAELNFFQDPDPVVNRRLKLDLADMVNLKITNEMTIEQLQREIQRDENLRILDGQEPEIFWFHDGDLHNDEIIRFLCSAEFSNLPPERRKVVLDLAMRHYDLHKLMSIKNKMGAAGIALDAGPAGQTQLGAPGGAMPQETPGAAQVGAGNLEGTMPQEMPGVAQAGAEGL